MKMAKRLRSDRQVMTKRRKRRKSRKMRISSKTSKKIRKVKMMRRVTLLLKRSRSL